MGSGASEEVSLADVARQGGGSLSPRHELGRGYGVSGRRGGQGGGVHGRRGERDKRGGVLGRSCERGGGGLVLIDFGLSVQIDGFQEVKIIQHSAKLNIVANNANHFFFLSASTTMTGL